MTKEQFDTIKEGDLVRDLFNGIFQVYDVGDYSEYFDVEEYNEWLADGDAERAEEYKRNYDRYFSCRHVDYDAEKKEWYRCGDSFDVFEWYAINEDNGNGVKRWDILDKEEIKEYTMFLEEEYEKERKVR